MISNIHDSDRFKDYSFIEQSYRTTRRNSSIAAAAAAVVVVVVVFVFVFE
jgi:hypothetical protein